jgi:hypothetical protein
MSYCRWSTDDFQCDLYCFEHVDRYFQTYVAGRRLVYKEPLPPEVSFEDTEAWIERHTKIMEMVSEGEHIPIGLPYDGEEFRDSTLEKMLNRIKELKKIGYIVPDFVIENIEEEIKSYES